MGLVIGEEEKASYGTLSKKLSPIVKLDSHCKLDFDIWSANGSNQIPSPQRIDNNKGNNHFIIEQINILFRMEKYIELFRTNRNLILTGAPGTGKTHLAKAIADKMGAKTEFVQFHPSYDYTDFVEGLRPKNDDNGNVGFERRDGVFKQFCKEAALKVASTASSTEISRFNKLYEILLQKIKRNEIDRFNQRTGKPIFIKEISGNNNLILMVNNEAETTDTDENTYTVSFNRLEKLSKVFPDKKALDNISNIDKEIRSAIGGCNSSAYWAVLYLLWELKSQNISESNTTDTPFVFIIDEINRGEISKIFGELFFSIDPGYRGEKGMVQTQYQNMIGEGDIFKKGFYVPENVYIIGTMNDIDRSVESMDFAMRRRFAWKEVTAEESFEAMKDSMTHAEEIKKRMTALNNAICDEKLGLNKSYQIGAAYFLKLKEKEYDGDFNKLWEYHLKGLLSEYLRGNRDAEKQLEKLKKAYDGNIDSQSE